MLLRFWRDDRATTAIEYCLIACIVSIAVFAGAKLIGMNLLNHYFQPVSSGLS